MVHGAGALSYKKHVQLFKSGDVLFIPKHVMVRISIHSTPLFHVHLMLYRERLLNTESNQQLANFVASYREVSQSNLETKQYIQRVLLQHLECEIRDIPITDTMRKFSQAKVYHLIRSNLKHRWTVDEICKHLFVSKATLYRELKKVELTFLEILTNERLDAAKRLLTKSNVSIERIAYECGFQSLSYFGKKFRARFGITPSQFRSAHSEDKT